MLADNCAYRCKLEHEIPAFAAALALLQAAEQPRTASGEVPGAGGSVSLGVAPTDGEACLSGGAACAAENEGAAAADDDGAAAAEIDGATAAAAESPDTAGG